MNNNDIPKQTISVYDNWYLPMLTVHKIEVNCCSFINYVQEFNK